MDREGFNQALQSLGLTQYQAEAYATTLRLGAAPAVEVARESDVPKQRIYDILQTLEKRGYVETYEQDSLYVRALDPATATEQLEKRAESLTDAAEYIGELWTDPDVGDHQVTLVSRRETVYEQATQYVDESQNEIQLAATPEQFDMLRPALERAFDRDVFIQLALCPPDDGTQVDPDDVDFEGVVTEVRNRTIPAPFLLLVDRSYTCFSPHGPGLESAYGLIAENYPLAHVFHRYFQTTVWIAWELVYSTRGDEPPISYINLRQCIADLEPLLADGATVHVTVDGIDTGSREPISISGVVEDVLYTTLSGEDDGPSLSSIARQVALVISTEEQEYTVGGWYARLEDVEMRRLTVERIE